MTMALNCAESATTNRPHTSTKGSNIQKLCPKKAPTASEQAPLTTMARLMKCALPIRSAIHPPQTHPMPPTAIAQKAARSTEWAVTVPASMPATPAAIAVVLAAALAARKAGTQVHMA